MPFIETAPTILIVTDLQMFRNCQVPGSYLANRYGGKAILALSYLLWAPVSALTAIPSESAEYVVPGVIACRMVIGMAQGVMLPAANLVLTHWVPSALRGRDFAFAAAGRFLGAAVAMVAVPIIGMRQRLRDWMEYSVAGYLCCLDRQSDMPFEQEPTGGSKL